MPSLKRMIPFGVAALVALTYAFFIREKKLELKPDAIEIEIGAFRDHAIDLFLQQNFAELEKIATDIRVNHSQFENGGWKIYQFHDGITYQDKFHSSDFNSFTSEQWNNHQKIAEAWVAAYPKSIAARAALMHFWLYRADDLYRDPGQGDPTWAERRSAYLKRAHKEFEIGMTYKEKSVMFYTYAIDLAEGLCWPQDVAAGLWEEGKALEPKCQMLDVYYITYARHLGHDFEAIMNMQLQRPDGRREEGYARMAHSISNSMGNVFKKSNIDWNIVKIGFDQMGEKYPNSRQVWSMYAFMAGMANDRKSAEFAFKKLKRVGSPGIWGPMSNFTAFEAWLYRDVPSTN